MAIQIYAWSDRETLKYIPVIVDAIKIVLKEGLDITSYFSITLENSFEDLEAVEKCFEQAGKRKGSFGVQYNVEDVLNRRASEGKEGIEIGVTAKDLFTPDTNFVYGIATSLHLRLGKPSARVIFSSCRIEKWYESFAPKVLFKTAMHETAHIFGVPRRKEDVDYSLGWHCIRVDCVMGQSNMVRLVKENDKVTRRFVDASELTQKMLERMERTGSPFCSKCKEDLIENKKFLIKRLF
ncbi:MAG: hypothetical protein QXL78_05190 [Methanocellales archaeon]